MVGYANSDLQNGQTLLSPTFLSVDATATTFKLSDLTVTGYDEGDSWGDVNIQLLTAQGKTVTDEDGNTIKYYWQDNEDYDEVGWYDGNDELVDASSIIFEQGTGLWIAGLDGNKLVAAGAVHLNTAVVRLRNGMTATGNPTAAPVALSQMYVDGYDEGDSWGDVNIQMLTAQGKTVTDENGNTIKYYWQDNEDYDEVGWYDGNDELVDAENIKFAPGQGLWVAGIDDNFLHFPAPQITPAE